MKLCRLSLSFACIFRHISGFREIDILKNEVCGNVVSVCLIKP
jgi:hypothetical protein